MLGISPKNPNTLLKYLGGLHNDLRKKVMLFKPRTTDEACVQAHCLDNIGHKKWFPNGSKYKENQDTSDEGKKKWKGKDNKMIATAH